jgi:hypothetical protein
MPLAQGLLHGFPLIISVFILFFGRLFHNILRAVMIFTVILLPLLGQLLTDPTSDVDDKALAVVDEVLDERNDSKLKYTPALLIALVWAFVSAWGLTYMSIKRKSMGTKIESFGVSFLAVMVLNSYYMGYLHVDMAKDYPEIISFMDWLTLLAVICLAIAFQVLRMVQGLREITEAFICALIGGFGAMQTLANMGVAAAEDLAWRRVKTQNFGCDDSSCVVVLTLIIVLIGSGTAIQLILYGKGQRKNAYQNIASSFSRMLTSLTNINKGIESYETHTEMHQSAEDTHKLRTDISEDFFIVLGGSVDFCLCTFSLGLLAAVVEMVYLGMYDMFEGASTFGVWLLLFAMTSSAVAIAAAYLRLSKKYQMGSSEWKARRLKYMCFVGVIWPFFVLSAGYCLTVGGEEIAPMDVPLINERFGFVKLPMGCDTLAAEDKDAINTLRDRPPPPPPVTHAIHNESWYDGDMCYDNILNNDEQGIDCGGSCNRPCNPCSCDWRRSGLLGLDNSSVTSVSSGSGSSSWGTGVEPWIPGVDSDYGDLDGCWTKEGVDGFQCFVVDAATCNNPNLVRRDSTAGGSWLASNDAYRTCAQYDVSAWTSGEYRGDVDDFAECTASGPIEARVWYCDPVRFDDVVELGSESAGRIPTQTCFECNVSETDFYGQKSECLRRCDKVDILKEELPTIYKLVWGVTICSLISAMSSSGALGGTYMLVSRLVTYITTLNLFQGLLLLGLAKALNPASSFEDMGQTQLWQAVTYLAILQICQSVCGLIGLVAADVKWCGWIFLEAAWLMAIAILIVMMGGLGVAIYLAMNIEQLAEEHWDENIQPELEATQGSDMATVELTTLSNINKHEFIEYARGSFRCLIMLAGWTGFYLSVLVIGTAYIRKHRNNDEADRFRARAKGGAVSNPMYDKSAEMASPIREGDN